ncbi:MAG: transglycosylase domain-containing protein [Thermoanaerobaculia bacterium]|nr:transglycosylase domain-containing protein [Thermoanaerobaculia bacterium]
MFKRLIFALLLAMLLWLAYEWVTFPDVAGLAKNNPSTTAFMELRRKELKREGKDPSIDNRWIAYGRISPHLRRAVLVAEDDQFYEHEGVDIKAMQDAIERDWKRRRITHGGSTITQQLAKNLYLSPSRNPIRKVREYFIARALEEHLT